MMNKRTIQKEDLFRLEFLQGGALSPDGKRAVYAVSHTETENNEDKEYIHLWLVDLKSGQKRQLTTGKSVNAAPAWSPDGRTIAFFSTRGDKPQIYLISPNGGEARQLTHLKQGVGGAPVWSPDGRQIAFSAGKAVEAPPDPTKPYRWKRKVYRFDGMGSVDNVVQNIHVISVDGGEARPLTDDDHVNTLPCWSPDGKEILYAAAFSPNTPRYEPGLRVVSVEDGKQRDIVWRWGTAQIGEWLPDGRKIAFVGQPDGQLLGTKNDLYVIDAKGEANGAQPENRTPGLKFGVGGGLQGDMPVRAVPNSISQSRIFIPKKSDAAYVRVQEGGTIQIYRVALKGGEDWEPLVKGERSCLLLDVGGSHLLYGVSTLQDPTQLYISDIEGGDEQALTQLNAAFLSTILQPQVEHFFFPSKDGTEIEAWMMKPPVGEAPYPTILYIHGGPWGAFGNTFSFDFQMLAGAGYAMLFTNYRGSVGYGDAFGTAIQGAWGSLDYEDHMAGVDYVIDKGWTDPDRLGVCGLSAGGFASCWIVGQTDRFKAAVPENPVTNLMTIYGVSDISKTMVRFMGGRPHEAMERYVKWSPITYAHRCKTPTLLIQGDQDHRCPPEQSEQFYAVLKDNGCIVEMLRLPNSPHGGAISGPLPSRKAQNDALLDWMNRYVLGKPADKTII